MQKYNSTEYLDLLVDGQAYPVASNFDHAQPLYLACDVDARIAELERALVGIVTSHNGHHQGVGPCICAAHEEARRVLGMTRDDVHPARSL